MTLRHDDVLICARDAEGLAARLVDAGPAHDDEQFGDACRIAGVDAPPVRVAAQPEGIKTFLTNGRAELWPVHCPGVMSMARATDPKAAAILDRVESATALELGRLHGTFREVPASPRFLPGARVRLRPGPRRTDAQDMFLEGKIATVESVLRDVEGRDAPDAVLACIGGGSNAMGIFYPFLEEDAVRLYGVEAAGEGLDRRHAATLSLGAPGVLHGAMSYLLQDAHGQVELAHSISAGLDYPGVGPEHAYLKDTGRVRYAAITDDEALDGVRLLARTEGIIPALESAHALALVAREREAWAGKTVLVNLSGRGDKDVAQVARLMGADLSGTGAEAGEVTEG